ncbi:MAG: H-X9-DG-CTERM domain-containing protein [Armatimonadota bacterium]
MLGVLSYAQDYDECLPAHCLTAATNVTYPGGTSSRNMMWYLVIQPYIKSVQLFNCPSARIPWFGTYSGQTMYGYSNYIINNIDLGYYQNPSQDFVVSDSDAIRTSYNSYRIYTTAQATTFVSDRHNDGANIALLDGHVKWYKVTTYNHKAGPTSPNVTHKAGDVKFLPN